jgi:hypothetical protein
MALVVVAHLEHFGRRLLAFHISLAQFLIDDYLHIAILLARGREASAAII